MSRHVVIGIVAICLALFLTGCERHGLGPAALSRDGDDLLMVVCIDSRVDGIRAESRASPSDDWAPFIDATGTLDIAKGTIFNLSHPIDGLSGNSSAPSLDDVGAMTIAFGGDDGFLAAFDGASDLDIPIDEWLQTSGQRTAVPCPRSD